jgi:3-oxoacyl-(acyl-carrier-protein) synthase
VPLDIVGGGSPASARSGACFGSDPDHAVEFSTFVILTFPKGIKLSHKQLRSMAPHVVCAYVAMREALADAGLTPEMVSDPGQRFA